MPLLPSRLDVIEHVRSLGRKVVAVMPIHYPRALLRAHRLHPMEIQGPPHVPRHEGSRHFQAYTCDIVVKATSFLIRGGIDATEAILVPHTCDALQGMASVLGDFLHQDSKVIRLGDDGRPVDFMMNDKCAAGTGRFLEYTAARLGVPVEELGGRALASNEEVPISSTCTVFAESEIISLIARGADPDAILRGLHRSLVGRVVSMVRSVGIVSPLMISGGVARNDAVRTMIAEATGEDVILPREPQLMGAYGAALLGGTGPEKGTVPIN